MHNRSNQQADSQGFTLIGLMVSVTIIGVLIAIAVPHFRAHILESRLMGAHAYLMQIATKQRQYYLCEGMYCCSTDNFDEDLLNQGLGLSVEDTGDFCFAFVCSDSSKCLNPTSTAFIAPAGNVLRSTKNTTHFALGPALAV